MSEPREADVHSGEELEPVEQVDEVSGEESGEPGTATGHPAVDEVLRSLESLEARPVDEHVAAFEDAHERLRRALSGAGDDTA